MWAQYRRARPARPAVRRGARRLRRRPGRDHDRDGGVRPRARAGALSRHRRAGRRPAAPRRPTPAMQAELLPQIAAGELLLAFAHAERQSRYELHNVTTIAAHEGGRLAAGGREGRRAARRRRRQAARHAPAPPARTRDRDGIGLFLVDCRSRRRVACRGYPTQDGLRAAEVSLAGATGVLLGDAGRRAAADRARGGRGDGLRWRRGGRRHERDARARPWTT